MTSCCFHHEEVLNLCSAICFRGTFSAVRRPPTQLMAQQSQPLCSGSSNPRGIGFLSVIGGHVKEGTACGLVSTVKVREK